MTDPVVLIPDLMCDARLFYFQINVLSGVGPVTISAPVRGERIEEMASHMLDGLPVRCAVAGAGLGGIVAMEILRRAPERVSRLALICADPQADTPALAAEREPWIARARAGRLDDVMSQVVTAESLAQSPRRMQVQTYLQTMAKDLGPDLFVRQQRALQRRRDYQGDLRRIKCPSMVIGGAEDAGFPVKKSQFLSDLIPKSHLRLIDGAGRFPSVENPRAVSDALTDWLALPVLPD